ncbi:MAG: aspartate aminotransferase family protein [Dehalococcoidia bacterium]|jgi:predicted acetylornithine/succinylornithine family transaminase
MTNWPAMEAKYIMNVTERLPLTIVRGQGARAWDEDGKEYLDFVGGWAVNSLGHCHPAVVKAITEQAQLLIHTSNQFYTVPQLRLAQLLVENSCLDKVFFGNSGAEANEAAIKLARRYGQLKLGGAYEIITTLGSFHGRTLATVAATGQEKFQKPFPPLPTGFVNVKYNSIGAIKSATTQRTCAVMIEPLQGEGGVNLPADGYLAEVRAWCDQKGILLILDEVQTGMGRTGSLFAYEQYGVEPDIMTLAKGLGSGVAIGAIMAKEKAAVFVPGEHGSTFGGNPLACAAGYATLKFVIGNDIPGRAGAVGDYLLKKLAELKRKHPLITGIRGKGLLVAVELDKDVAATLTVDCLKKGLLVNQLKANTIRFMPPLIIGNEEVDEALGIFEGVLAALDN